MNNDLKSKIKKYSLTIIIGLIITVGLLFSFNFFSGELSNIDTMKALSDAFSVSGILLLAYGALIYVSTEGMFDGVSYAGMFVVRSLVPGMRRNPIQKYGDYKVSKEGKRCSGYAYIFFIGLGFLAVGIIFTILFFTL